MLPNHAPLIMAEHYGTLATLYPGRIDLGSGGRRGATAPRRARYGGTLDREEDFPQQVRELLGYLGPADRGRRCARCRGGDERAGVAAGVEHV